MIYRIKIKRTAAKHIDEAAAWYEAQIRGLSAEFLDAINACVSVMARFPEAYPIIRGNVRRAVVHKFPYSVFYTVESSAIIILACLHSHRNPKAWPKSG